MKNSKKPVATDPSKASEVAQAQTKAMLEKAKSETKEFEKSQAPTQEEIDMPKLAEEQHAEQFDTESYESDYDPNEEEVVEEEEVEEEVKEEPKK